MIVRAKRSTKKQLDDTTVAVFIGIIAGLLAFPAIKLLMLILIALEG